MRYLLIFTVLLFFAFGNPAMADHHEETSAGNTTTTGSTQEGENPEWPPPEGMIVHTEINVTDLEVAMEFYNSVFGWEKLEEESDENYWIFMTPGEVSGGFSMEAPPGMGGVVIYIYTSDIEAKLVEVEEAGGTVFLGYTEIPESGAFAWFSDPDGNILGLFTM